MKPQLAWGPLLYMLISYGAVFAPQKPLFSMASGATETALSLSTNSNEGVYRYLRSFTDFMRNNSKEASLNHFNTVEPQTWAIIHSYLTDLHITLAYLSVLTRLAADFNYKAKAAVLSHLQNLSQGVHDTICSHFNYGQVVIDYLGLFTNLITYVYDVEFKTAALNQLQELDLEALTMLYGQFDNSLVAEGYITLFSCFVSTGNEGITSAVLSHLHTLRPEEWAAIHKHLALGPRELSHHYQNLFTNLATNSSSESKAQVWRLLSNPVTALPALRKCSQCTHVDFNLDQCLATLIEDGNLGGDLKAEIAGWKAALAQVYAS